MKWMNPRNQLPDMDKKVWILVTDPEKSYPTNSRIYCGNVLSDIYTGERSIAAYGEDGRVTRFYFYGTDLTHGSGSPVSKEKVISAWAYSYEGEIPKWGPMSKQECLNAWEKDPSNKAAAEKQKRIDLRERSNPLISWNKYPDIKPVESGTYVVVHRPPNYTGKEWHVNFARYNLYHLQGTKQWENLPGEGFFNVDDIKYWHYLSPATTIK